MRCGEDTACKVRMLATISSVLLLNGPKFKGCLSFWKATFSSVMPSRLNIASARPFCACRRVHAPSPAMVDNTAVMLIAQLPAGRSTWHGSSRRTFTPSHTPSCPSASALWEALLSRSTPHSPVAHTIPLIKTTMNHKNADPDRLNSDRLSTTHTRHVLQCLPRERPLLRRSLGSIAGHLLDALPEAIPAQL